MEDVINNLLQNFNHSKQSPTTGVKHVEMILNHFWKRFSAEYLRAREKSASKRRSKTDETVKVDVVLIHQ